MKEFCKRCKRVLAMFMAVAMLLSAANIGIFAPTHVHAVEPEHSVTLGVLIKENFGDELNEEEVSIITSGYLSADKTYAYEMPGDNDDLITVDEKEGTITAKKYTDPEYGTQWLPVTFSLTDGTNAIEGYKDLTLTPDGNVFVGTYELEERNPGNSFTVEVTYSLDLTLTGEDKAAQQQMLDAARLLAADVALMEHLDAVSVIGDDPELAQKIVDLSGGFISNPNAIYAETILDLLTMDLNQLGGVSAVDLIYELVGGIKIPAIEHIDFDNGTVLMGEEVIELGGTAGKDAATSLHNQEKLKLFSFIKDHSSQSYLEWLVVHGDELESALRSNYEDLDYLSNLNSASGLKDVSNKIVNLLEKYRDDNQNIYDEINNYLEQQDLNRTINSVAQLRAFIEELESADGEVYAAIDEKLSELDADMKQQLEEFGVPDKVENADDLDALKNAMVKAYKKIIDTINDELSQMDASTKSELAKKGAPAQVTLADTSSYDAFVNSGDQDIIDLTALSNALDAICQDALKSADDKLQEMWANDAFAEHLEAANVIKKINTKEDIVALRDSLDAVKTSIYGTVNEKLADMYTQAGDMADVIEGIVPREINTTEGLLGLQQALTDARAAIVDEMIKTVNSKLAELPDLVFILFTELPRSVNNEDELNGFVTLLNDDPDLRIWIDENSFNEINNGMDALDKLDAEIPNVGSAAQSAVDAINTLDEAKVSLGEAVDGLTTLEEASDAFAKAKSAVAQVKPYIGDVLNAQEQIALLNDTYLPMLNKVADGLQQLEDGIALMADKQELMDMLILMMQKLCATLEPLVDAFDSDSWNAPKLLDTTKQIDFAALEADALAAGDQIHSAKDVLHVATAVVKYKLDMYDVTVSYEAVVIDPAKADSTDTLPLNTVTHTVTLTKGATKAEILAEIAAQVDENEILEGWAISTDNYDRTATVLPDELTENITYTISYAPKLYTVTFSGDYPAGTAPVQVPYGYRMTLPLNEDVTSEYTYTVNGTDNIDQGTVITITEDTAISRDEGAISEKQYLTDLVVNTDPAMDPLVKNILLNQALNRGEAISIRVPGKDQLKVSYDGANGTTTITAKPYFSRVGDKYWNAAIAMIDGVSVNLIDGVHTETQNPGFDKVVVNYELAIAAADLGITDEQLLATMNIPYELVTDYTYQQAALDALSTDDASAGNSVDNIMGLLEQLNNKDYVLTDPSELTLKDVLYRIESLNESLELNLGEAAIQAALQMYEIVPDSGYIPLYYTLEQYNEQGMIHYYRNEQTYINQIIQLNDILTVLLADQGFCDLLEGKLQTFQVIRDVLSNAASLAEPEHRIDQARINLASPYLESLVTALGAAAEGAQLTPVTQAPSAMIWTAAVEQPGPSKRTVTMTVDLNGAQKTDTKTVSINGAMTYAELTAWAQSIAKELGLKDEVAQYYVASYSFTGDMTFTEDTDLTATWALKSYEVRVDSELIGTVTYADRDITLAAHADPNYQYEYYINDVLYSAGTYTLTLAQFQALTEDDLIITRKTVDLRERALIKLIDSMNGAAVLTKNAQGEYAIVLRVDPDTVKEDMTDAAIGLFLSEYKYIGLDNKVFFDGSKYHLQAAVDTALSSGVCTDSLLELIDVNGNIAQQLTLADGEQILNTVAPDYLDNLGGVVMQTVADFGAAPENTTPAKLYITLAGTVNRMATARKALLKLKEAGVTFDLNNNRANLNVMLPDQAYGAYLAALSLVGEVDIHNVNDVNAEIAIGYVQDLLEPAIGKDITVETYENTLAQLGREVDLSRFSRYFELFKKAYDTVGITYADDTATAAVENVSINAAVTKLQSIVDGMELPAGVNVDLSKLIYEYDDPATNADDATSGVSASAALKWENLSTDYAAMFLDVRADGVLNKLGMWTEAELIAGSDDFAGASVLVLLDDVQGDLTVNTKTLLDLNGKTVNGNVVGGEKANLIIIDSAYEQAIPGGVTGTVSGNVTVLEGKYASDVSAFLDNGYVQGSDGVVSNKLYAVTVDANGNSVVTINATPGEVRDLISKKGIVELAMEMAAGLVLNNYNKASLSIEGSKVYNININDVIGLFASDNKINAAIDTGLSWISASELTDIANMFIEQLTDFAAIETALAADGKLATYTFTTAPWELEIVHIEDGDYLSMRVGASDKTKDVTLDIVVNGSVIEEANKLIGALADTVTVDVEVNLDDIYRDDDNVIHVSGDAEGIVEIDFTEDPAYVITMAAILADGADAALKAKLEAGIEQYYTQNSLSKLESTFREITIKQLCDSLGDHSRTENFTSIVNGLNLTADTKTAVLSDVNNDEMGYKYVVDAVGVALRLLQSRGRLESVTQRGVALGAFEDKDETSFYYGFVRDAHIEGVRKVFRSYKLGYDLDVTKLSVKVRLFLDHVHNFVENPDEKYLKAEATCITQAEYYLSCDYEDCGIAHSEKTFFYGDLAPHDYQEIVDDKYLKEEATCTTQAEYYKSCSVCGEAHESETFFYGDLEPHDYKEIVDDKYLKEEATCTTQAEYYKSCSVCGEAHESETFFYGDLEPHDYKEIVDDKYLKEEATCTSPAEYYKSCSVCGEAHESETFFDGDPLPHNYVNVVADKYLKNPATCTSPAEYYKSCSVGGEAHATETFFDGEALSHNYVNVVADKYLKNPATCTSPAEYYKSCSVGGEAHATETFFDGEALPHNYVNVVADKYLKNPATCTSPAEYYKSCSVGGEAHATETFFDGNPLPHNYVNVVADKYLKNPATCTSPAEYYKSCSVGGEAHPTETFFDGDPLDHTDANNDGLCDHCGESMGTSCNHDQLTHVPANPATTAGNGNKEHWYCPVCNKYFADAAGTQEITQASTVIAALPAVGIPNMPVGGNVYGFLVDSVNNILFADIVKAGMTEQQFKSLLAAAVANDADNKPEIKVTGIASSGLVCTTSKVTLTAENKDGAKMTVTYDIVIIGDTNCNGRIESGDAVKIDRHYRGQIKMVGLEFLAADTNRNSRLESGDAVKIMTKYQNSSRYVTALKK